MLLALARNEPMISSSLRFLDYHNRGQKVAGWGSWELLSSSPLHLLAYLDLSPCYHPMSTRSRGTNWAELSLSDSWMAQVLFEEPDFK